MECILNLIKIQNLHTLTALTTGLFAGVPKPVVQTAKFDIVFTRITHAGYRRSCLSSVVIRAICGTMFRFMMNDNNQCMVSIYSKIMIIFKSIQSLYGFLPILQILLALDALLPIG